jgi:hypothetical protein
MYDRGSFVCGRGYTSYYENPPLVCGRRHLHGCPDINKAWATDSGGWPEDWVYDWGELLNRLMTEREIEKEQDLIGETYFEGYVSPFPLHNLVPIESIVEAMNEKAWDISGEYAGDWPDLTSEDKKKLKNVIVRFLKKRRVKEFSSIENIVEKTITADDIREGTE